MLVVHSNRTDVYENLAAEDAMLDDTGLTEPVVFIYRNSNAVVIGKNQNPWRECAVGKLESLGVKLARRISGGGTVFHDNGNINISCILPRHHYCREDVLKNFISGLSTLGLKAEIVGGSSLAIEGQKISGNAFCFRQNKVLHHGTLLWNANLQALRAALIPELPDIATRAIASVPMTVMNLLPLLPAQPPEVVVNAIIEKLAGKWGAVTESTYSPFNLPGYAEYLTKMASWDWIYGATPDFTCSLAGTEVHVHRGYMENVAGTKSDLPRKPFMMPG